MLSQVVLRCDVESTYFNHIQNWTKYYTSPGKPRTSKEGGTAMEHLCRQNTIALWHVSDVAATLVPLRAGCLLSLRRDQSLPC